MGQSQLLADDVADTVITNALIVDWWGIVKADVGLKNGRIWKIGKAGNPDIQPNITIPLGAATEVIAGKVKFLPQVASTRIFTGFARNKWKLHSCQVQPP